MPHPLFGILKGTVAIAPGTDLSVPTCPNWDAYADLKYGPESEMGKVWAKLVAREDQDHASDVAPESP